MVSQSIGFVFSSKDVIQSELEQLRQAEDAEHEQMELMIMKRMRQISLTESESLSDIARHVIQELESDDDASDVRAGAARDCNSDEDLPKRGAAAGTSDSSDDTLGVPVINRVSSEPNINRLGGSLERDIHSKPSSAVVVESSRSGSASPPNKMSALPPRGRFDLPHRAATLEDTTSHKASSETTC